MNWELPDVQARFRKGRGTSDQIAKVHWIIEKAREFQKNIYCCIDYAKAFVCVDHNKLENSSRDGNTRLSDLPPEKSVFLMSRSKVRAGYETTDCFQIGKGVHQGCILSLCLFNLYAEYIMRNGGLDEAHAEIKTAGKNINNFRYVDDTTLMAES